jgi:hypothetical protein
MKSFLLLPFLCFLLTQPLLADFKLVCPPDVTISCTEDYSDLNRWGKAYTDENGHIQWQHDCKIVYQINDCGVGTIMRTWGVLSPETWQWITCSQLITLSNANAFGYRDITFPPSLTIESCNPEDSLKRLPRPYDKPVWKTNKCAKPMLSYSDVRYKTTEGCTKIVRTWKVLDWCVYDPYTNPGAGIFVGTQVIKLITTDPTAALICLKDTLVIADKECGGADVSLPPAQFVSVCNIPFVIRNNSPYARGQGADASGIYPVGITKFYFTAEYACGTEIKCEMVVRVESKIPPTPYCLTGAIIDLMPVDDDKDGVPDRGMIEVWASDLNKGSFHKCPGQKLVFSFSKDQNDRVKTFTCDELGDNEVEIWVTDTLGNQDFCKTTIQIQNNLGIPNCKRKNLQGGKFELSFSLRQAGTNQPVSSLTPLLLSPAGQIMMPFTTPRSGKYEQFDLNTETSYELKLKCSLNDLRHIDGFDLLKLEEMIQNPLLQKDPLRLLAADLNADDKLDETDVKMLRTLLSSEIRHIDLPTPYKVIPADYVFADPLNPFTEYRSLKLEVRSDQTTKLNKEFLVIKTGDISSYGIVRKKSKPVSE